MQVDTNPCPEIRKGRNTLPKVKDTIAMVSYRAGISVPKAQIGTQTVCEKLYVHIYHLHYPKLDTIDEEAEPSSKKPQTAEDYKSYNDVFPSVKSINISKQCTRG